MTENKVLKLDDMRNEQQGEGQQNLQAENNQLKATLYQMEKLYKNYVILTMILIQKSGGSFEVSEAELNDMGTSNLGLQVQTNDKEETATFTIAELEETEEENDNTESDSTEDIPEQVSEDGEGDVE